jgi:hypothetical protein
MRRSIWLLVSVCLGCHGASQAATAHLGREDAFVFPVGLPGARVHRQDPAQPLWAADGYHPLTTGLRNGVRTVWRVVWSQVCSTTPTRQACLRLDANPLQ